MKLLGIDIETGKDFDFGPEDQNITEVGAVLWDTDFKQPVMMFSSLVNQEVEIHPDPAGYTGVTTEMVQRYGRSPFNVLSALNDLVDKADYVVEHNGLNFDNVVIAAEMNRHGIVKVEKPIIDTMIDIEYPVNCINRNLTYLAGFHLILNSFPHRAIADVLTMFAVLMKYDIERVIEVANSPMVEVRAIVSYDEKEKAKKANFRWDAERKWWVKETRQLLFDAQKDELPFKYQILVNNQLSLF